MEAYGKVRLPAGGHGRSAAQRETLAAQGAFCPRPITSPSDGRVASFRALGFFFAAALPFGLERASLTIAWTETKAGTLDSNRDRFGSGRIQTSVDRSPSERLSFRVALSRPGGNHMTLRFVIRPVRLEVQYRRPIVEV